MPPLRQWEDFTRRNRVKLLRDAGEAYPAMLRAIEEAQHSVYLEMYWFASDAAGERFKLALKQAKQRGVQVCVLYDSVGSIGTEAGFLIELSESCEVVEYNPVAPWSASFRLARFRPSALTRRDHRKLLVVDRSIAFTGGLNLAEQWLPLDEGGAAWRDDAILVEGQAAAELARCFERVWRAAGGHPLAGFSPAAASGQAQVAVLPQSRRADRRIAVQALLHRLTDAQSRAWLANAYFVPGRPLVKALGDATRRGIDVRVIVPSVSDVPLVRHASRAVWGRLLAAGARIYEWQPSVLHSKTALIDADWTTIGSLNLDTLSMHRNLELNVAVRDAEFAQEVERSFLMDLEQCVEVDRHDFAFRSLGDRVLERVAYWFRGWL